MRVSISVRLRHILIGTSDVVQVTLIEWDTALDFINAVNNMLLFSKCWAILFNGNRIHFKLVKMFYSISTQHYHWTSMNGVQVRFNIVNGFSYIAYKRTQKGGKYQ